MLILGTANTTAQTVLTNGVINLGSTYRRYSKKNNCNVATFTNKATSVSLNQTGIYHITATFVASGTAAGNATIQMFVNGVAVPRDISTETITTADTEVRTFVIDDYVLVDSTCVLGRTTTVPASLSFINTGIGTTIQLAKVNIDKVL